MSLSGLHTIVRRAAEPSHGRETAMWHLCGTYWLPAAWPFWPRFDLENSSRNWAS